MSALLDKSWDDLEERDELVRRVMREMPLGLRMDLCLRAHPAARLARQWRGRKKHGVPRRKRR